MYVLVRLLWRSKNESSGSTSLTRTRPANPRARRRRRCPPGNWEWRESFWRKYVRGFLHSGRLAPLSRRGPTRKHFSLLFSFWKLQLCLACVLGSDHATRCVFTAPPHTHTDTHTSSCSLFETRNWNHRLLHTVIWQAPPPSLHRFQLDSLCHLGPHEGGFSFSLDFSALVHSV